MSMPLVGIVFIYLLLIVPHIRDIPYLDGNIDLVKSYDFFSGGMMQYAHAWPSLHPPLKVATLSVLFQWFGVHAWSYNLFGMFCGILGVVAMYGLAKRLFGSFVANVAALFLAIQPLYLALSISSLIDFLVSVFVLIAMWGLAAKQYLILGVVLSLAVMTKETAVLLPAAVLVVSSVMALFIPNSRNGAIRAGIASVCALGVYACWTYYLRVIGQTVWSDWNFSDTAGHGTMYTIMHNMVSGAFINEYATQNWLHLFVFNYAWIFTGLSLCTLMTWGYRVFVRRKNIHAILRTNNFNVLVTFALFFSAYTLVVLSFQTYTITRYVLPCVPFLILLTAACVGEIKKHSRVFSWVVTVFLTGVLVIALHVSSDPVSRAVWGDTMWLGERIYNVQAHLAGNDGIAYNLQYLSMTRMRTAAIEKAQDQGHPVYSPHCGELFADPNNELKMLKILRFSRIPERQWCVSEN